MCRGCREFPKNSPSFPRSDKSRVSRVHEGHPGEIIVLFSRRQRPLTDRPTSPAPRVGETGSSSLRGAGHVTDDATSCRSAERGGGGGGGGGSVESRLRRRPAIYPTPTRSSELRQLLHAPDTRDPSTTRTLSTARFTKYLTIYRKIIVSLS